MRINLWKVATIILALSVIVLAVILIKGNIGDISPKTAVDRALTFINERLSASGEIATLESIDSKATKIYKFTININGEKLEWNVSSDGNTIFPCGGTSMVASFSRKEDVTDVCKEDGKPIIYFFGSAQCPHCEWEKPILESVISEFGDKVSFHENIDSDKDQDVFAKYSDGAIPAIIVGCKYYRIGSGESVGEEQEKLLLRDVICSVTGNLPAEVCGQ